MEDREDIGDIHISIQLLSREYPLSYSLLVYEEQLRHPEFSTIRSIGKYLRIRYHRELDFISFSESYHIFFLIDCK